MHKSSAETIVSYGYFHNKKVVSAADHPQAELELKLQIKYIRIKPIILD